MQYLAYFSYVLLKRMLISVKVYFVACRAQRDNWTPNARYDEQIGKRWQHPISKVCEKPLPEGRRGDASRRKHHHWQPKKSHLGQHPECKRSPEKYPTKMAEGWLRGNSNRLRTAPILRSDSSAEGDRMKHPTAPRTACCLQSPIESGIEQR